MEKAAYIVALLTVVTLPGAAAIWLVVHPFIRFWRRAGAAWTYLAAFGAAAAVMAGMFAARGTLLSVRFGVRTPLVVAALLLYAAAIVLRGPIDRRIGLRVLLGLPEVSAAAGSRGLVTDGIYARLRHPRYVNVGLATAAMALFSNNLAAYLTVAGYVPVILLIVRFEERELRDRFGAAYEEYCARVPRFLPRLRRR
ncbi:MAG: hypothetical protein JW819_10970 [Candidatus Krumholzibacteriota bacterium]|nr:hypothetical protein [Candidatus Krumholzibacteriota bacterium]